jgi:predicted HTH domain antitoxin
MKMSLVIDNEILQTTRMTEKELLQEIAIMLFEKEKLSLGQASKLAEMNLMQFQHLLASRSITVHYGVEDFEQDLKTLEGLRK